MPCSLGAHIINCARMVITQWPEYYVKEFGTFCENPGGKSEVMGN